MESSLKLVLNILCSINKINAHALARYAALVQEAKMVPIVEPEVLMDGSHNIDKCYEVTTNVLNECYKELSIHKS